MDAVLFDLWVCRQANGLYAIAGRQPIWARIDGVDRCEWYPQPGDRAWQRNLCSLLPSLLVGPSIEQLEPGHSVQVRLFKQPVTDLWRMNRREDATGDLSDVQAIHQPDASIDT